MAIRSWIESLSRESPSEFRRYRQLSSALFLILAIGGAGLLGVSIAWELWGNGSKAQGTREVTGAEQTALQCADELGLLEQRLAQSLGALAGKATPEAARSAWADFHRDWDRDLAGVVDRCQGTSVPGHEAFARATADLTAIAQAYDALAGELIAGPVPRSARWRADLGASRSALLTDTGTARRAR